MSEILAPRPDDCDHEWEYSDQSEPHKGIEYFACRKCENVAIVRGDSMELVPNYSTMRDDDHTARDDQE